MWTALSEGRRLLPGRRPLAVVPWPDGRPNYAIFEVEACPLDGHR